MLLNNWASSLECLLVSRLVLRFIPLEFQGLSKPVSGTFSRISTVKICINRFFLNLSLLANCRPQFLLDCLGRCLKLFISTGSTSSHESASQFGLAIFLYAKNTQKLSLRPSLAKVFVECAGHGRSIASDNMSGNSDHCQ